MIKLLAAVAVIQLGCVALRDAEAAPGPQGGPIAIAVDATDAPRHILHAKLSFPARPGPMTLLYPRWIPGEHSPSGPIMHLVGIRASAGGKPVGWRRDPVDLFAFHVEVPANATSLDVELDYLSPSATEGASGGSSMTASLVDLAWNQVVLYPVGAKRSDEWTFVAKLKLPPTWKYATALPVAAEEGATISFKPASLTTLVDSPVVAGAHFRRVDLSPGDSTPHALAIVADSEAALAAPDEAIDGFKRLVKETGALFGARHYKSYTFLYTLSDHVQSFGLEHHESSDDRTGERTFLDDDLRKASGGLLPHEMVHSWNGKYRRPAGLATASYEQTMIGDLLWVYEGLTDYLGHVLTARSGIWDMATYRENLAAFAAHQDNRPGRTWRPLSDTAVSAPFLYYAPGEWASWRREVDFYEEGDLLWLEVDVVLRRESKGKRSIDDFCKKFHGGESGPPKVVPYTLEDVVKALNELAPYDWKKMLLERVDSTAPHVSLGGITGSGWKLVYDETPNDMEKATAAAAKRADYVYSLGFIVGEEATLADVVPGSPAAIAGLAPGMKLVAVNARKYTSDVLDDALKAGLTKKEPLELLVDNADVFRTVKVDYHGGARHPHLVRDQATPDVLSEILKPHAPSK